MAPCTCSVSDIRQCSRIVVTFSYGRAKTIRKRYAWTRIFSKTKRKKFVFKRKRIRVDGALVAWKLIFIQTSVSLNTHEVLHYKISLSRVEIEQLQCLPSEKAH